MRPCARIQHGMVAVLREFRIVPPPPEVIAGVIV
jgi:hypothetical protein